MRVLESGVDMTPEELNRLKGGACACGCEVFAEVVHALGSGGGTCFCTCKFDLATTSGIATAATYL